MTINRQDKVVKSVVGYGFSSIHPLSLSKLLTGLEIYISMMEVGRDGPPPEAGNHFICELRHTLALIHILLMPFSSSFHTTEELGVVGKRFVPAEWEAIET